MITEKRLHANIDISSEGNNIVIVGPTGQSEYLAIDHINLNPDSAVSIYLQSGDTELSGTYSLAANQLFVLDNSYQDQDGILTCGSGETFLINLSAAVQVSGFVKYRIINR